MADPTPPISQRRAHRKRIHGRLKETKEAGDWAIVYTKNDIQYQGFIGCLTEVEVTLRVGEREVPLKLENIVAVVT